MIFVRKKFYRAKIIFFHPEKGWLEIYWDCRFLFIELIGVKFSNLPICRYVKDYVLPFISMYRYITKEIALKDLLSGKEIFSRKFRFKNLIILMKWLFKLNCGLKFKKNKVSAIFF